MLITSVTPGLGAALGAAMPELVDLKKEIDYCTKAFPLSSSSNVDADIAANCQFKVDGTGSSTEGLLQFEKVTLLAPEDNALLFDIARTLLSQWRNTNVGSTASSGEANTRRIAATKLGEPTVFDAVSPTLAVQTLSSAGRVETNESVLLPIILGIAKILSSRDIPDSVRTEALTTLKILADPLSQRTAGLTKTAQEALQVAQSFSPGKPTIEVGPVVVLPVEKPASKFAIPIIVTVTTAIVAAGVLWAIFRRRSAQHAYAINAAGPLRRRVEAQLRRRRAKQLRSSEMARRKPGTPRRYVPDRDSNRTREG
jgi:hypothetical protein